MEEKLFGKELITETTTAEGNIELSFKSRNMVAMTALATGGFMMFFVFLGTSYYFIGSFWLSLMVSLGLIFAYWYFLSKTKDKITVVGNKGIKFLRQELPFSSIDEFFLKQKYFKSKTGNAVNLFSVAARVRGREIVITRDLSEMLAREVLQRLATYSGKN